MAPAPAPPSPSFFFDLHTMPDGDGGGGLSLAVPDDDLILPYISRILMEDDADGKLLHNLADHEHPALLQAQEPFAQILSGGTFLVGEAEGSAPGDGGGVVARMDSSMLLQGAEETTAILAAADGVTGGIRLCSKGADAAEAMSLFLKGMEEASRFLPNGDMGASGSAIGCKRRHEHDGSTPEETALSRANKLRMVTQEDDGVAKMFDEMMLHGHEYPTKEMLELGVAMKNCNMKKAKGSEGRVDLLTLLTHCAQAVAVGNRHRADELLQQIRQYASSTGDAVQRLASCFAEGLEARLGGTGRQLFMTNRASVMELIKAYKLFITACPFKRVAFSFSSKIIYDTMAGKSRLHIVDYGVSHGLQWSGLLYWLANREGGPPEVKITVIDVPQPGFRPAEWIEEIGCRLRTCATAFGLPLKFHAVVAKWDTVCVEDLNIELDEVLIVNDLFMFSQLADESVGIDGPSPRDAVLGNIKKLRPDLFIQGIANRTSGPFFLTRFREALFSFSALFDMMDATVPRESHERLVLEQDVFGRRALNAIACEGVDRTDNPETYRQWQMRNRRAGLRQLPLKPGFVKIAMDKVKSHYHKDFVIDESHQWLLQGWKGRILYAHSIWVAEDSGPSFTCTV